MLESKPTILVHRPYTSHLNPTFPLINQVHKFPPSWQPLQNPQLRISSTRRIIFDKMKPIISNNLPQHFHASIRFPPQYAILRCNIVKLNRQLLQELTTRTSTDRSGILFIDIMISATRSPRQRICPSINLGGIGAEQDGCFPRPRSQFAGKLYLFDFPLRARGYAMAAFHLVRHVNWSHDSGRATRCLMVTGRHCFFYLPSEVRVSYIRTRGDIIPSA